MKAFNVLGKIKNCPNSSRFVTEDKGGKEKEAFFCSVGPVGIDYKSCDESCSMSDFKKRCVLGPNGGEEKNG